METLASGRTVANIALPHNLVEMTYLLYCCPEAALKILLKYKTQSTLLTLTRITVFDNDHLIEDTVTDK